MKQFDAVGISCAVVKGKKIVFSCSIGRNPNYSDLTLIEPLRDDGLYYWASVSKTFIGTAIMQLVEKGILTLDDDVNEHLCFPVRNPYFPDRPITVRMLLCHRSSLKKNAPYLDFDVLNSQRKENVQKIWNSYSPGTKLDYSNLGFVILGAVIETASGLRLDDYIDKNILSPIGLYGGYDVSRLDSCRFVKSLRYDSKRGLYVKCLDTYRYPNNLKDYRLGISTPLLRPAGGMIMSVQDLARYMMMHINKGKMPLGSRIISKKSEEQMRERQFKSAHGLSMVHFKGYIQDKDLVGMTGGAKGMHSVMMFSPEDKYGFVIISNGYKTDKSRREGMLKLIMRELYTTIIKKKRN